MFDFWILQVKLAKVLKKGDKIVSDSQERAYWRVHRPPPGIVSSLEQCPVPTRCRNGNRTRKRTIEDGKREVSRKEFHISIYLKYLLCKFGCIHYFCMFRLNY